MTATRSFTVDTGGTYCIAAPNSAGPGATIGSQGSVRLSAADLVLTVDGAPASQFGIFFHGSTRIQAPFGDGFRCVGGGVRRLTIQMINGSGHAERAFDGAAEGIGPSEERDFQFWYRDPMAAGSGHNLSDGLAVVFCP